MTINIPPSPPSEVANAEFRATLDVQKVIVDFDYPEPIDNETLYEVSDAIVRCGERFHAPSVSPALVTRL